MSQLEPLGPEAEAEVTAAMAVIESHEASLWSEAFKACADFPGDPLGAVVKNFGDVTVSASRSMDFSSLNRVLGVVSHDALDGDRLDEIVAFYNANGVTNFRVEVPNPLLKSSLAHLLESRGLAPMPESMAKIVRGVDDMPDLIPGVRVRRLVQADRDDFITVSQRAWGLPRAFRAWYAGSFDTANLHHFGVEDAGRIVSVGSAYLTGEIGWLGYDATLADFQGKHYQRATGYFRNHYLRDRGCTLIHGETRSEASGQANHSLRHGLLHDGYQYVYERSYFEPVAVGR